jgi:predicted nucleotidyltransferase
VEFGGFLVSAAGSRAKARVLCALASLPSKKWTGNSIAKEAGVSQPQACKVLHELEKQGLVAYERSGRAEVWQFNDRHVFAKEIKALSRPREALVAALLALLKRKVGLSKLSLVLLFGSVARNDAESGSDIDLLVVYPKARDEERIRRGVGDASSAITALTGNSLAPIYYTEKEFDLRKNRAFEREVLTQGILIYQRGVTQEDG